ncbi:hypothetical protein NW754_016309 [Fusarium falciforme]|nr:hypothetical protein NW754_016309 [Fusarium falciforme]
MPWSRTNLKAYLPEEEHHKVDGSIHGPIIDAAVQRSAAISHDTTDTLGRMVHARLERIHGRIDSLAGQSRAIEQKAQDELHEAVNSVRNEVLSTLVDLGKELRQEYTAKFSTLEKELRKDYRSRLDDLEDAFAERMEKVDEELRRIRKNPSVPNPPGVRTPPEDPPPAPGNAQTRAAEAAAAAQAAAAAAAAVAPQIPGLPQNLKIPPPPNSLGHLER